MDIRRIYVEKKKEIDIDSQHLLSDIKENLLITSLEDVKILSSYDIGDISDETFEMAVKTVFSEPPVEKCYYEEYPVNSGETMFLVQYLPGQYDQRADSAVQCIKLIDPTSDVKVLASKTYVLKGNLSQDEIAKIKNYCINPVDSCEINVKKPDTLMLITDTPNKIPNIDIAEKSKEEKLNICRQMGLALSDEDFLFTCDYFIEKEKRNPTETEIRMIDTYWSDHCRHTTFLTNINKIDINDGYYKELFENSLKRYLDEREILYKGQNRAITLMDMATIGAKALRKKGFLDDLDESEEVNACSINIMVDVDGVEEEWLLMFKNETHNHPTEIEPLGGASTCLGGAIRDPLSGRAYVYQAMRVTGCGDPRTPISETLKGKLPQRQLTTIAAAGYASYGNQIGLTTGQVTEIYDEGYVAKRMELGAVIGAVKKENVVREKPTSNDVVLLVGGRTGRDGCGGATGSSREHTVESIERCSAEVQKGNAPIERNLQRLFRKPEVSKLIKKSNDFGAGGVSVAIVELADGVDINLDLIPKKYEGLNGTELAISESQERMAVVVSKDNAEKFIKYAREENLEATVVANITDDRRIKIHWQGDMLVDISRDFLDTNGVMDTINVTVPKTAKVKFFENTSVKEEIIENDIEKAFKLNLEDLNRASQKGLVERFDSTVGKATVVMPLGGKKQLTPSETMVAKIPVLGETNTVSVMSFGYNPVLSKESPFHGALYAVVESVAKIAASGCDYKKIRLSFQEYFEKLDKDETKWAKPFSALLGSVMAQLELALPSIGGKDSMSGTFNDINVPPTLVSFAVATDNIKNIVTSEFKGIGNTVVAIQCPMDSNELPIFEKLKENLSKVRELALKGKILSAATVKSGGYAELISKMAFGNDIGFTFMYENKKELFKPYYGTIAVEVKDYNENDFEGISSIVLGKTTDKKSIIIDKQEITLKNLLESFAKPLENIFPTKFEVEELEILYKPYRVSKKVSSKIKFAKPTVYLPIFPGTNCEFDMAASSLKAGAKVSEQLIRNLTANELLDSTKQMVKKINDAQMIMISGGFSAGDEPAGSAKFISNMFRNPEVAEAIHDLLYKRDGLILGICNGFQALIKLGLLPNGRIGFLTEKSPTITYNKTGRHISKIVNTKVVSNKTPWLYLDEVEEVYTIPISHGEGRFYADEDTLKGLFEKGQVCTQYVDDKGNPTYDCEYNPNNSYMAIEGLCSEDGKVFGKMGHIDRIAPNLYKNIPGLADGKTQRIFEAGVNYFM